MSLKFKNKCTAIFKPIVRRRACFALPFDGLCSCSANVDPSDTGSEQVQVWEDTSGLTLHCVRYQQFGWAGRVELSNNPKGTIV